jgi:glycosyltransferase involved in cell wall biosynthesis
MKLYIVDHLGDHKTTKEIEKWFEQKGHEVKWTRYWEPEWGSWCDTALFAWTEGMLQRAITPSTPENKGVDILKDKKVVSYLMDIEMWAGQHGGTDWSKVDYLVYCSKYIYDVFIKEADLTDNVGVRHIPLSVDVSELTFRESNVNGRNIATIGHMWPAKGAQMIPEFMLKLIKKTEDTSWKIHVLGWWRDDVWRWYRHYFDKQVKDLGLENNIILTEERVPSVDEWLNDKDYLVTFSMKDAFSLIVGEALAKGIPAYPHNFPGATEIWGDYTWKSIDGLIYTMLNRNKPSLEHKKFVTTRYSNEIIMPKWEEILLL